MKPYKTVIIWLSIIMAQAVLSAETIDQSENSEITTNNISSDFESVSSVAENADNPHKPGLLIIAPIHDTVDKGLVYIVRRSIKLAVDRAPSTIIIDMDTYGGRGDSMEEIMRMFLEVPENVHVYTFVNKDALSAGALIAMATDRIYMATGARIGASAPVSGDGKDLGDTMKEKFISSVLALAKEAARENGHDPKVLECMVRAEVGYSIGDQVICPTNQLLTLSASEAAELVGEEGEEKRPLLSLGTYKSIEDLKKALELDNIETVNFEVTFYEKLARFIEMLAPILMTLGMIGLYVEFKSPGFGVPGLLGILFLSLVFWGSHIAGLSGMGEILFLVAGTVLLLLEIFVIPGFGFAGITGIFLIGAAMVMALVQHTPGLPAWHLPLGQLENAAIAFGTAVIASFFSIIALTRYLPRTSAFERIALGTAMTADKGYQSSADTSRLIGDKGIADTNLHPGGIGQFKDKRLDVVSYGDFIDKGERIIIVETHGNRIIVDKIKEVS